MEQARALRRAAVLITAAPTARALSLVVRNLVFTVVVPGLGEPGFRGGS